MALLISIIFMSVVLAVGLSLASFGYKQIILVSSVTQAQNAFYAADSALECVLYADQHNAAFFNTPYHPRAPSFTCNNNAYTISNPSSKNGWQIYTLPKIRFDNTCALVSVYKGTYGETYIFATGYSNNTCTINNHVTVRGIDTHYGGNY